MSDNKFIERLKGKETAKSVLEVKNQATKLSFANMPQGTSNAIDVFSDHRGNATAVLNGTTNWKISNSNLLLANTVSGDGQDFLSTYSVSGTGLWVNASYTFPSTGDPRHPIAMVFNPSTKWVLKVCGDNLIVDGGSTIDFTMLVKIGTANVYSKNFTVRESAGQFSKEFVIDFGEANLDIVKAGGLSTLTVQLLCGTANASARIYNGMSVLTCLQRKVDASAVSNNGGNVEDVLNGSMIPVDYFSNPEFINQIEDGEEAYAVFTRDGDNVDLSGWKQPIPDQANNNGKFLTTDGSDMSWEQIEISNVDGLQNALNAKANNTNRVNGAPLSNTASAFYGVSDTAAATVQKEVSIPSITTLDTGTIIIVRPTITSTVANSTLKLNDFPAYPMRYNNAAITTSTDSIVWSAAFPSIWVFDGTYWVFAGHGVDSNTTYSAMSVAEGTTGTATSNRVMTAANTKQIIQGTTLTGIDVATTGAVSASDTITEGIGKLQATKADKSELPTVGNGTITITQGGVSKGTFTTNQSGNTTIALDAGGGGAVDSVNGKTGVVVLTATDVGALPDSTVIPTVNNPTITITQGGVTKGSFTLNQSTGDTIALDAGGGSIDAIDGVTITKNSDNEIQAVATINANTATGATNPVYDWVGTLAEYNAQNIESLHPDWMCYITDDVSGGLSVYTKSEVDTLLAEKADTALSNLTATGANIANWSSNVSNCITEIPQDIKLELNNGTLTLKAGSKCYLGTDTTTPSINIVNDLPFTPATSDGQYFLIYLKNYGSLALADPSTFTSIPLNCSFPLALVTVFSGAITSIDQIFNGFGYFGSTVFALPGVKGLIPVGRNADGSLKSIEFTTPSVFTDTLSSAGYYRGFINELNIGFDSGYYWQYNENTNFIHHDSANLNQTICCHCVVSGGRITRFTINSVFHAVDYSDFAEHKLIAFQQPTSSNGYSWYRKYADGWVEQGGFVNNRTAVKTISLPITMAFGVYNCQCTSFYNIVDETLYQPHVYNLTQTSFQVASYGERGGATNTDGESILWFVSGLAD